MDVEGHDDKGRLDHLWHKWHMVHEVIAAYGLMELVSHLITNGKQIIEYLHHIMELVQ